MNKAICILILCSVGTLLTGCDSSKDGKPITASTVAAAVHGLKTFGARMDKLNAALDQMADAPCSPDVSKAAAVSKDFPLPLPANAVVERYDRTDNTQLAHDSDYRVTKDVTYDLYMEAKGASFPKIAQLYTSYISHLKQWKLLKKRQLTGPIKDRYFVVEGSENSLAHENEASNDLILVNISLMPMPLKKKCYLVAAHLSYTDSNSSE